MRNRTRTRTTLTGQLFGRLIVLGEVPRRAERRSWYCRCNGGTETTVGHSHLRLGETRSCGCLFREATSARSAARFAAIPECDMTWRVMHLRRTDPTRRDYAQVSGRGIRVCAAWDDFAIFTADLGPRPSPSHRLTRLDESADFTPHNGV